MELIDGKIKERDVDILFWGYTAWRENNKETFLLKDKDVINQPYDIQKREIIKAVMLASNQYDSIALNTTWGKAFRTEFVKENKLFFDLELKRSQDVIYNLYAFNKAKAVNYVDTAGSNYRLDNDSLSRGYNEKTFERMTKTANACLKFCNEQPDRQIYYNSGLKFCRRCYRIIIRQDFANKSNPEKNM